MVSPADRKWVSAVPSPKIERKETQGKEALEPTAMAKPESLNSDSLKLKPLSHDDDQSSESTSSSEHTSSSPSPKYEPLRSSVSSPLGSPLLTRLKNSPTVRAIRATLSGNYSQKLQFQTAVKNQLAALSPKSGDFSAVNTFTRIFEVQTLKDAFKKMCAQEGMSTTFDFIEDFLKVKSDSAKAKPNDHNVAIRTEETVNKYPEFKEATQKLNFASHTYTEDVLHAFEASLTQIGATLKEKFKDG